MMLRLDRLEVEGFGPFADRQTIDFPPEPGVTVVYGENMRGKTSLLNAIRYAFFGTVLGRGSRVRKLAQISNRDLAAHGKYGFSVSLTFHYDGDEYELVRECVPRKAQPQNDDDYAQDVLLRKGNATLGPNERIRALHQIFPLEVSRFFLFDGELLQEYEELLINESEVGHKISEAIERILGVPILKSGRRHLDLLARSADRAAAAEASKHQETQATGTALALASEQREAHQAELDRAVQQLADLTAKKQETEQYLLTVSKYASILEERERSKKRLDSASAEQAVARGQLQIAMADAWRTLLRDTVRSVRNAAQEQASKHIGAIRGELRAQAVEAGHCGTCDRDLSASDRERLRAAVDNAASASSDATRAMIILAEANRFQERDNAGEIRELAKRIQSLDFEQTTLRDRIADLELSLEEANPDAIRRGKASFSEVTEKISIVKQSIGDIQTKLAEFDANIERLKRKLEATSTKGLRASQARASILRDSADVLAASVERYKDDLRGRVEQTASDLFLSMTTEKIDYAGLRINPNYGLTIVHRDGRAEEARSAGAEHVVALALMGALQRNAPLRGPIVMDSPFGRLDDEHTSNVIRTLPSMADQVILFVYRDEVGPDRVRQTLGPRLIGEYELEYVAARRTNVRKI